MTEAIVLVIAVAGLLACAGMVYVNDLRKRGRDEENDD